MNSNTILQKSFVDDDMQNAVSYAKHYINTEPSQTIFKKVLNKYTTHYNHFTTTILPKKHDGIYTFIFDDNVLSMSNTFRNICLLAPCNILQIKKVQFINYDDKKQNIPFDFSGEDIETILTLDKTLYELCVFDKETVIPISKLLVENECIFHVKHSSFKITIEYLPTHVYDVNPQLVMDSYNLTKTEATRIFHGCHEYTIKDYKIISLKNDESKLVLRYKNQISAIIIVSDQKLELNAKLDQMQFIRGDSKFIPLSSTPNILSCSNYYLVTDSSTDSCKGYYICNPKTLTIDMKLNKKCKVIIQFFSHMTQSFNKLSLDFYEPKSNYPLTKIDENNFIEGYWFSDDLYSDNINYPFPISEKNKNVSEDFLTKLHYLCNTLGNIKKDYQGGSQCRLCNEHCGGSEYKIKKNDITFTFPNGIFHYYECHNVMPSNEFLQFIMDF
jgi:hypothetical protein